MLSKTACEYEPPTKSMSDLMYSYAMVTTAKTQWNLLLSSSPSNIWITPRKAAGMMEKEEL